MRGITMTMRIATAAWADPEDVEQRYAYRDGTLWLGRSGSDAASHARCDAGWGNHVARTPGPLAASRCGAGGGADAALRVRSTTAWPG